MTMEMITAIALWCSTPSTLRTDKFHFGSARSVSEIQKCRDRLFICVENRPSGPPTEKCFREERLQ